MEADEPRTARTQTLTIGEDLSVLSVEQLKEREADLHAELERTRAITAKKQADLAAADSLFRK
jgi:uncharacterized small protein (DUF1192 family)